MTFDYDAAFKAGTITEAQFKKAQELDTDGEKGLSAKEQEAYNAYFKMNNMIDSTRVERTQAKASAETQTQNVAENKTDVQNKEKKTRIFSTFFNTLPILGTPGILLSIGYNLGFLTGNKAAQADKT